jgi:lipid-binding SYLF domain-containing protein
MKDRFGLGGEAGVAAGPVGRNAGAATDALMHAAMLSYSRSRGVFAGLALKGVVIKAEDDLNLAVYNKTAEELLKEPPEKDVTSDLQAFPRALNRYADQ